ncbi:GNAT family N-acetyltransferase [Parachitinimonas caeni]|uniref:GNAT family N-acetyltransferase n=1 Tax=Parachitinimonas caeni TaxID=3031301 RepID=A0ABT7DX19_9NEIS|nr:GNAT family N-acetyltransferase [Parachitinimonas caeni]MDK2124571.1 GNAT family N-acetyltransferase [Parachitinimonas caeni]
MPLKIIHQPSDTLMQTLDQKITEFNVQHWEVKQKYPLAIIVENEDGELQAGATAKTFGDWLLIENIWVSESLRGQNLGSQLLAKLEQQAIERGCRHALLDTLNFQARAFYERYGYTVQWTQEGYPRTGCKHFMTKTLTE